MTFSERFAKAQLFYEIQPKQGAEYKFKVRLAVSENDKNCSKPTSAANGSVYFSSPIYSNIVTPTGKYVA